MQLESLPVTMQLESLPVPIINKLELNEPIPDLYIINSFSDEYPFVNYKNKIYMVTNKNSYKMVALHGICMDFYAYSITRHEFMQKYQSINNDTKPITDIKSKKNISHRIIKSKKNISHRIINQNSEKYSNFDQYEDNIKKCPKTKKKINNSTKLTKPKKKYSRNDKNLLWQSHIINIKKKYKDETYDPYYYCGHLGYFYNKKGYFYDSIYEYNIESDSTSDYSD